MGHVFFLLSIHQKLLCSSDESVSHFTTEYKVGERAVLESAFELYAQCTTRLKLLCHEKIFPKRKLTMMTIIIYMAFDYSY